MAKIKSAIELAMEKTAGLTMDDEEKKSFEKNDLKARLKGWVRRYLEGIVREDSLMRELISIKGEEELKGSILLEQLIGELDIERENDDIFRLLDTLYSKGDKHLYGKMGELEKTLRREMEKKEESIRKDLTSRLKATGIYGDAVKVNIAAWEEGRNLLREINGLYRERALRLVKEIK